MATTAMGNSTLAGNAARNCANGCTASATRGRKPIQTPIGTQIRLAMRDQHDDAGQREKAEPERRDHIIHAEIRARDNPTTNQSA